MSVRQMRSEEQPHLLRFQLSLLLTLSIFYLLIVLKLRLGPGLHQTVHRVVGRKLHSASSMVWTLYSLAASSSFRNIAKEFLSFQSPLTTFQQDWLQLALPLAHD